jgi:hypothetical protein
VQTIGDLDQQHAHVAGGRHDHLAQVLGARLLRGAEPDPLELGDPVDQHRNVEADLALEPRDREVGVLDRVVEERSRHRRLVEPEAGEDRGHLERVGDEGLARLARLARVGGHGELVGPLDDLGPGPGAGGPHLLEELFEGRRDPAAGGYDPLEHRLDSPGRGRGAGGTESLASVRERRHGSSVRSRPPDS